MCKMVPMHGVEKERKPLLKEEDYVNSYLEPFLDDS